MSKVFLDPGHGGRDPGVSILGLNESDLVLEDALAIGAKLLKAGVEVKLSRNTDIHLGPTEHSDLQARSDAANAWGADLFVSLHINGFNDPSAHGTETWHRANSALAQKFQTHMTASLGLRDRGAKNTTRLSVLNRTRMPAVLLEPFFLTNDTDHLTYLANRDKYQTHIALAILEHFNINEEPKEEAVDNVAFIPPAKESKVHDFLGLWSGGNHPGRNPSENWSTWINLRVRQKNLNYSGDESLRVWIVPHNKSLPTMAFEIEDVDNMRGIGLLVSDKKSSSKTHKTFFGGYDVMVRSPYPVLCGIKQLLT